MASLVPVMISFGMESSSNSFSLFEVDRKEKLSDLVESHGPDDWGDLSTTIVTKVSQSKSSPFDKFNLNNSVDLVLRVLKTDVLWIRFEKSLPPVSK
jgi:hypothetical protein